MNEKVAAAFIAGAVALIGMAITYFTTRWQTSKQVESKIDELTQTQFQDILAKRIEVYPLLWRIVQTRLSDLERQQRLVNPNWAPDAAWARDLLVQLMTWHQDYGVFLSQASYDAFATLRNRVADLVRECNLNKHQPTLEEFQALDRLYYMEKNGRLPLATNLKNDLGSYKTLFVSH